MSHTADSRARLVTAAAMSVRAQVTLCLQSHAAVWRLRLGLSILSLLPGLHAVFQGREAVGVSVDGGHRPVLVALQVFFPPRGPFLVVSLNVEVCEESNQGNHVSNLEEQPPEREGAWPEDPAGRLDDCQHKLDQLPLSDVLFPPEVGTHGRDGGQTIVRVHEDMDEAVECRTKI